jgi:hypothetical protein
MEEKMTLFRQIYGLMGACLLVVRLNICYTYGINVGIGEVSKYLGGIQARFPEATDV